MCQLCRKRGKRKVGLDVHVTHPTVVHVRNRIDELRNVDANPVPRGQANVRHDQLEDLPAVAELEDQVTRRRRPLLGGCPAAGPRWDGPESPGSHCAPSTVVARRVLDRAFDRLDRHPFGGGPVHS